MMGRASEPEMLQSIRLKAVPKLPKPPYPSAFGTATASQDSLERVNVAAGGQAIVGTVTPQHVHGLTGKRGSTLWNERRGSRRAWADTPMWSEAAGWPALPKAEGQGADTLQAARRGTRQQRTKG